MKELLKNTQKDLAARKIHFAKTTAKTTSLITLVNIFGQLLVNALTSILAIFAVVEFGAIASTGNLAGAIFNGFSQISTQSLQLQSTKDLFAAFYPSNDQTTPLPSLEFNNSIRFEDVSYQVNGKKIFNHLSLVIKKDNKYALTGKSGSGKSTLLKILNGQITDYTGNIYIDDQELRQFLKEQLTERIQYVDQTVHLFNTTVKNNLTLWNCYSYTESLLQDFQLDFIQNIDETIQENGKNLSGGQRQRLALARTLLSQKEMLCIDEGTSSLDQEMAQEIERNLLDLPNTTILMTTHHLSEKLRSKFDGIIDITEIQSI